MRYNPWDSVENLIDQILAAIPYKRELFALTIVILLLIIIWLLWRNQNTK